MYNMYNYLYMLIQCYQSYGDSRTLDQLFQLALRTGGWSSNLRSVYNMGIQIYIPETASTLALLIDPNLLRISSQDYIL